MYRLLLVVLLGCGSDTQSEVEVASADDTAVVVAPLYGTDACPDDSPLTWDSFGAGYIWTWCTPCHGSAVDLEDRQEAPSDVNFDTHEDAVFWADRLEARGGPTGDMPPAGGPDEVERALLLEWVACGLP